MTAEEKIIVALDALKQARELKGETLGGYWKSDHALKTRDVPNNLRITIRQPQNKPQPE